MTCSPVEGLAQQYRLADQAEITVVVYARQRVFSSFAFAEGQLRTEGIDNVLKGVDAMLERLKNAKKDPKRGGASGRKPARAGLGGRTNLRVLAAAHPGFAAAASL